MLWNCQNLSILSLEKLENKYQNNQYKSAFKDVNQNDLPILKEYVDYDENHLEIWEKILKNGYKPYWVHGYEQDSSPVKK